MRFFFSWPLQTSAAAAERAEPGSPEKLRAVAAAAAAARDASQVVERGVAPDWLDGVVAALELEPVAAARAAGVAQQMHEGGYSAEQTRAILEGLLYGTHGRLRAAWDVFVLPTKDTISRTAFRRVLGLVSGGAGLTSAEAARLFAFHKPSGLITAERDPRGRPTIYTALRNALPKDAGRVIPVGRLDFTTEGLLMLTNDGELKRAMELPSSGIPRTYRARAFGDVTQAQLDELIEGVEIDGIRYGRIEADLERGSGKNRWVEMTLTEGKNREVRRVLEHLGLQVNRLLRTAYGPFELADLPRGQAVEIRQADVERFRKQLRRGGQL